MRILMSAVGSPAATSIVKHLQKLGHHVVGIDANEHSQSLARNICDEFYLSPLCNRPEFIPFIHSISSTFDLYLPFIDEELIQLSNNDVLPALHKKIVLNDVAVINTCTSKIKFQQFCQKNNLPIAEQTSIPPAIYKPEYGRGSKGIFIIEDEELIPYFQKKQGVIQKLISGVEYTVDVLLDHNHQWLFAVARKRIETAGVSRTGEIDQNIEVLALAKKCCETFNFKGPINIQIMLDEHNKAHLIEINPRLSGSLIFTTYAGFDILDLSIKSWLNQPYKLPINSDISCKRFIRFWNEYIC